MRRDQSEWFNFKAEEKLKSLRVELLISMVWWIGSSQELEKTVSWIRRGTADGE